jgi:hypothetical protein
MRINVYAEELTTKVQHVAKKSEDGRMFYAVRLMLESSPKLHNTIQDDDRSGIAFWVPWSAEKGNDFDRLCDVLAALYSSACHLREFGRSPVEKK